MRTLLLILSIFFLCSFGTGDGDKYAHLKKAVTEKISSYETKADSISFIEIKELDTRSLIQTACEAFDFKVANDSSNLQASQALLKGAQARLKNAEAYTRDQATAESDVKKHSADVEKTSKVLMQHISSRDSCRVAATKANTEKGAGYSCLVFMSYTNDDNVTDSLSVRYLFIKDQLTDSWPAFSDLLR